MLKRLLWILLGLASLLSFVAAYHRIAANAVEKPMHTVMQIGQPFWMPTDPAVVNPRDTRQMGHILATAARRAQINLVRPSFGYTSTGQPAIIEFVYLTHATRLFQSLTLRTGHFPTPQETQEGTAFVSSVATGKTQQVGRLHVIVPVRVALRPLADLPAEDVPWAGEYWVDAGTSQAYAHFVQQVVTEMNAAFGHGNRPAFKASDFTQGSSINLASSATLAFAIWGSGFFQYSDVIWAILAGLTMVLLVYYGFSVAKRVGILKLNGWSTFSVWYVIVGRMVLIWILASAGLSLTAAVASYGLNLAWVAPLGMTTGATYVLVLAASAIFGLYVRWVRIQDVVKQQRRTGAVLAMNTALRMVGVIMLLVLGTALWHEYHQIRTQEVLLGQWHHHRTTQTFGIPYPIAAGHNLINIDQGNLSTGYIEARWLYPVLAHEGAMYLDASSYEEGALALPEIPGYVRMVTVNPNYLRRYPVETPDHHAVIVPNQTTAWVVLVPVQYRAQTVKIRRYVAQEQANTLQAETLVLHTPVPPRLQHQTIRIIWTANGQRLFSWNPTVFPTQGNCIVSPIIQVQTLGNTVPADWMNAFEGSVVTPLKIPLIKDSPTQTEGALSPILRQLHLTAYIHAIVPVNQAIHEEIRSLQLALQKYLLIGIGLAATVVVLMIQNAVVLFTRYQKRFLVRRLFGWGRLRAYRECFGIIGATWVGQVLIAMAFVGDKALLLAIPLVVADGLISMLTLESLERSYLAQSLKEGI